MNWNELTWRCDICREERPDDKISVHKVDLYPDRPGVAIRNVKYCNDRSACQAGAINWQRSTNAKHQ